MLDAILGFSAGGWVSKSPSDDYWYIGRGTDTSAGTEIDEDAALTITTVFACIAKVAKTLASLPISVVEQTSPRTRTPIDHPLKELLDGAASDDASGMTLREALSANLEAWGAAYALIDWQGPERDMVPGRLQVLASKYIVVKRDKDTGELVYEYNGGGKRDLIPERYVWHIPGLSLNGITGLSTVAYNREALGLSVVTTQFGNSFFGNGAWAGGFLQRPIDAPELSPEAGEQLIASINEKFRGAKKAFGLGLLREGMEFKQIDMPFEDAMFLSTRKFQRVEICAMFDVPPIMIHDPEKSTYANSEQADITFAKHSITPRCVRIEKAAKFRFFRGKPLSLKHNLAGLVRGDFQTQSQGFALGRQWGWYSVNDILELMDRNPIEGGDTYLEPLNMIPVGQPRPVSPATEVPLVAVPHSYPAAVVSEPVYSIEPPRPTIDAAAIITPPLRQAAEEIAARQCKAAKAAWTKHAHHGREGSFAEWADSFFVQHAEIVQAKLEPIVQSLAAAGQTPGATAQEIAGALCREWQTDIANEWRAAAVIEQWKTALAGEIVDRVKTDLLTEKELAE